MATIFQQPFYSTSHPAGGSLTIEIGVDDRSGKLRQIRCTNTTPFLYDFFIRLGTDEWRHTLGLNSTRVIIPIPARFGNLTVDDISYGATPTPGQA